MKNQTLSVRVKETLELVFRIYVCTFLSVYATGKLTGGQFYTPERIPDEVFATSLGMASNFDLAWTFMGRSFGYIMFIGVTQLVGSVLLLFNRTKLIGTSILIPIMVNIIVFDIFFLDAYGALGSALIYFLMLIAILWFNKEKVWTAFTSLIIKKAPDKQSVNGFLYKAMITLALFGLIFLIDQWVVNALGHGKG